MDVALLIGWRLVATRVREKVRSSSFFLTYCNQCYKHFTGLYLQVCKTGLFLKSIIASHVVKFNMLMLVFAFNDQVLQQKSMKILNQVTLVATNDFKNRPVLQTCKYRPVNLYSIGYRYWAMWWSCGQQSRVMTE